MWDYKLSGHVELLSIDLRIVGLSHDSTDTA